MKLLDISHYQNQAGKIDWNKVSKTEYKACFVKCTEGIGWKDTFYQTNKEEVRKAGLLFGAYHFARMNDPVKEAKYFCDNVGDLQAGEIVILDFEVNGTVDWCFKWLKEVERILGFKPMLYTNEARVKGMDWKTVVANNTGLWVAKYASQAIYVPDYLQRSPVSGQWPFWAIWQYSSRASVSGIVGNVDVNVTKMSIETLKKYGKKVECLHCKVHCPVI
ncbi:MAG: glycoside hydrolase family 25 protein [Candidatus Aenigmarchaeota archaeon]|nr:glycoside hydrolase family 25 protein [Candidatus Aenigmarchaeota archaeon]